MGNLLFFYGYSLNNMLTKIFLGAIRCVMIRRVGVYLQRLRLSELNGFVGHWVFGICFKIVRKCISKGLSRVIKWLYLATLYEMALGILLRRVALKLIADNSEEQSLSKEMENPK